jgi:Recombination endonuclease VII
MSWRKEFGLQQYNRVDPITHTKVCTLCGEQKSLNEFYTQRQSKDGQSAVYRSACKSCVNVDALDFQRKHKFNVSAAHVNQMLEHQGHKCPICETSIGKRAALDHNHKPGAIRGLLCNSCNSGLGFFVDNPRLLLRARRYLLWHEANPRC